MTEKDNINTHTVQMCRCTCRIFSLSYRNLTFYRYGISSVVEWTIEEDLCDSHTYFNAYAHTPHITMWFVYFVCVRIHCKSHSRDVLPKKPMKRKRTNEKKRNKLKYIIPTVRSVRANKRHAWLYLDHHKNVPLPMFTFQTMYDDNDMERCSIK